jgi:hypothetical protein
MALELCAEATAAAKYEDWFWKTAIGRCHYRLGYVVECHVFVLFFCFVVVKARREMPCNAVSCCN